MTFKSPLAWPEGRPRTPPWLRRRSPYGPAEDGCRRPWTLDEAISHLDGQMQQLGAERWQVNADLMIGPDGWPISNGTNLTVPAVTVTFYFEGQLYRLACDRWTRVEDNLHACALYINWQRRIERCGAGTIRQAFKGHLAPPTAAAGKKGKMQLAAIAKRKAIGSRIAGLLGKSIILGAVIATLLLGACTRVQYVNQPVALDDHSHPDGVRGVSHRS